MKREYVVRVCIECEATFSSLRQSFAFESRRRGYCNPCGRRVSKNQNSRKLVCIRGHELSVEGKRRRCKICQRETVRCSSSRRRAEKKGSGINTFTPTQWSLLLNVFSGHCAYCFETADKFEQDHIIPLSRGGQHILSNIVPACRRCNRSKHNKSWKPVMKFGGYAA